MVSKYLSHIGLRHIYFTNGTNKANCKQIYRRAPRKQLATKTAIKSVPATGGMKKFHYKFFF